MDSCKSQLVLDGPADRLVRATFPTDQIKPLTMAG